MDVEGLQYMIQFSVGEEEKPQIHMRCYLLKTKKAPDSNLPRVEVEEMGPRIDFRVGRIREADPEMMKEAMKKPKSQEVCSLSHHYLFLHHVLIYCYSLKQRRTSRPTSSVTKSVESTSANRISAVCRRGR